MTAIETLYLLGAVVAFLVFAGALAWGDAQSRKARMPI
ncbi:MAG: hypothetical protein JWN93_2650 [Hyphomicrobiales bacterium]|nr:hypothetical protein [Hyphomicrobiales bacterium]